MPCPYARDIRGAVAYCRLARRKVSTLRFPCKGNYRACPIYVRLAHIAQAEEIRERREPAPVQQPVQQAPQPPPTPTRSEQPRPSVEPVERVVKEKPSERSVEWGSGEAICDSLILALLISAASTVDVYRGDYRGLIDKLVELDTDPQSFLLLVGSFNGATIRATYKDRRVFSIMSEVEGETLCGSKALGRLKPVEQKRFDLVIYRVKWDALGGWKDYLLRELKK